MSAVPTARSTPRNAGRRATPPAAGAAPPLAFRDRRAWSTWLAKHHARSDGVWLRLGKKGATAALTYAEALEVALAWGWIDGQLRPLDDASFLRRFTPRRPRSTWSKVNREKAEALLARREMRPPGLAEVERAKADGRWDAAYDPPSRAEIPAELAAALSANAAAARFFATLDSANRYAVLWRVQTARRPETRARRIADLVAMLARGERIHP